MSYLINNDVKPLDILTKTSFENAIKLLYILGGSTNAVIHLLAISNAAGINLKLEDFIKYQDVPVLSNMKPHGEFVMNDLNSNNIRMDGVIKYLMNEDIIDGTCKTITGKTLKENYDIEKKYVNNFHKIIFQSENPF